MQKVRGRRKTPSSAAGSGRALLSPQPTVMRTVRYVAVPCTPYLSPGRSPFQVSSLKFFVPFQVLMILR